MNPRGGTVGQGNGLGYRYYNSAIGAPKANLRQFFTIGKAAGWRSAIDASGTSTGPELARRGPGYRTRADLAKAGAVIGRRVPTPVYLMTHVEEDCA